MYEKDIKKAWSTIKQRMPLHIDELALRFNDRQYKDKILESCFEQELERLHRKRHPSLRHQREREAIERIRELKSTTSRTTALTEHFLQEITGHFNPLLYTMATSVIPHFLTSLLKKQKFYKLFYQMLLRPQFRDYFEISGEYLLMQRLAKRGTILLVPTHSSNLDSIMVGTALHLLKLPPFLYGAGINLFENKVFAPFMERLGAYKVDREKKSEFYKTALIEYATYTLEIGRHGLFFPGGTRSRDNQVEQKLKKGLLSSALRAHINLLKRGHTRNRIFIVPATINYKIVLEASTLIDDFLQKEPLKRSIITDDESSLFKPVYEFMTNLLALNTKTFIRIGRPLDPFGNEVNAYGESINSQGDRIDTNSSLLNSDLQPVHNWGRDKSIVNQLGIAIGQSYRKNTIFLSTHVLAKTLYDLAVSDFPDLGDKNLEERNQILTENTQKFIYPSYLVKENLAKLVRKLRRLSELGHFCLEKSIEIEDTDLVFEDALQHLSHLHHPRPIRLQDDDIVIENIKLIFFYQNRMADFNLEIK